MHNNNISIYDNTELNKNLVVKTKHLIENLENIINNILDKYQDKCKYYIHINDSYYCISFKVGFDQINAMINTMFYIYIYKDVNNLGIVKFINEKDDHPEWTPIKNDLIRKLQ